MKERILFTSESVSEGHPDKVCDQISDAILDECFKQDPNSRVACECFATTNLVVIGGEITTNAKVDYEAVARNVLKEIGYDDEAKGMDYKTCKIEVVMDSQSSDIALGTNEEVGGAGDQGIMFGYATKETEGYMPLAISIAHHLVRYASTLRHDGTFKWARPDMKAQVTIDYTDEKPVIDTILMSIQHDDDFDEAEFKKFVKENIMDAVVKKYDMNTDYRYIAKNVVAANMCDELEIQLSYAIGVKEPTSIYIDTKGTEKVPHDVILEAIKQEFDLTPAGIIHTLNLRTPIYKKTASYGHFGRPEANLPWEQLDKVENM